MVSHSPQNPKEGVISPKSQEPQLWIPRESNQWLRRQNKMKGKKIPVIKGPSLWKPIFFILAHVFITAVSFHALASPISFWSLVFHGHRQSKTSLIIYTRVWRLHRPSGAAEENLWFLWRWKEHPDTLPRSKEQKENGHRRQLSYIWTGRFHSANLILVFLSELKRSKCLDCPPRSQIAQPGKIP